MCKEVHVHSHSEKLSVAEGAEDVPTNMEIVTFTVTLRKRLPREQTKEVTI